MRPDLVQIFTRTIGSWSTRRRTTRSRRPRARGSPASTAAVTSGSTVPRPSRRVTCLASRIDSDVPVLRMIVTPTTPSTTIAATLTSAKRPTAPPTDVGARPAPRRRSLPLISTAARPGLGAELEQLFAKAPVEARPGKLGQPHHVGREPQLDGLAAAELA